MLRTTSLSPQHLGSEEAREGGRDSAEAFSEGRVGDRHAHPGPGSQRPPLPRPQTPGPLYRPHSQTLRPQAAGAQLESLHGEACRGRRGAGLSLRPEPTGPDRLAPPPVPGSPRPPRWGATPTCLEGRPRPCGCTPPPTEGLGKPGAGLRDRAQAGPGPLPPRAAPWWGGRTLHPGPLSRQPGTACAPPL